MFITLVITKFHSKMHGLYNIKFVKFKLELQFCLLYTGLKFGFLY
jgi:hypothetical protein